MSIDTPLPVDEAAKNANRISWLHALSGVRGKVWAGVLGLLLAGALLRIVGLGYDLPYVFHPDEPIYLNIIQRIFTSGNLNPEFFNYPTLFFYLNVLVYLPVFAVGRLFGWAGMVEPVHRLEMGSQLAFTPEAVLVSRMVSVVFGLGAVLLLYLLGRRLARHPLAGLLAASLLALSPTAIKINRFVTPDTFVVFFVLATVYASLLIFHKGRTRDYLLAGIFAGLAASSKYNAGLAVLVPLAAHFLREGWRGVLNRRIYFTLLFSGLAFFLTSPFILLDFNHFWKDFSYEAEHYSTGHPGMEGDSLIWYIRYLWRIEGFGVVLGVLSLFVGALYLGGKALLQKPAQAAEVETATPFRSYLVVFIFPLVYFGFISGFMVRNDRTLLPVIPFLLLAAGLLLAACFRRGWQGIGLSRSGWWAAGTVGYVLALVIPLMTFSDFYQLLKQPLPVTQAREWIETHVPENSHIVIESYAPYLDQQRYQVTPLLRAFLQDAGWYRAQGVDYVVFAEGMYGRYYCEPVRYYPEKSRYDRLFRAFEEVAIFPDPQPGIPIVRIFPALAGDSPCLPRMNMIYTHEVRIYRVP